MFYTGSIDTMQFPNKKNLKWVLGNPLLYTLIFLIILSGCTNSIRKLDNNKSQITSTQIISPPPTSPYFYFLESKFKAGNGKLAEAIVSMKKAISLDQGSFYLKKELVILHLKNNDSNNAFHLIENLVKENPGNVDALIIFAKMQQIKKDFQSVKETYERVLEIDPMQEGVYLLLGNLYMEHDQKDEAHNTYSRLLKNFPDSFAAKFYIGKILTDKKKYNEAVKHFKSSIQLAPELVEPKLELINIYKIQNKAEAVIKMYKSIIESSPDNIEAAIELGLYYNEIGNNDASTLVFKQLGIRSFNDPGVVSYVDKLLIESGKFNKAIVVLEGMMKGAPENSDIYYMLGTTFYGQKKNRKAIKYFLKVSENSGFYSNSVLHISYILQEQKKTDKAIKFLKNALKKHPENTNFFLYLGTFYEEIGDYANAEETFLKGLTIDDNNIGIHFRLGVTYDKWGKREASAEEMKKVITLDPKNANALNYLGYSYADLGINLDEAEKLIKRALIYKPGDGYITDSLGWVYFKKGLYKEALRVLKKAVNLIPDDPILLEHLGDAYEKNNKPEKALEFYRKSLSIKTENKAKLETKIKLIMKRDLSTGCIP